MRGEQGRGYNFHRSSEIEDKERIDFPPGRIANRVDYREFHRFIEGTGSSRWALTKEWVHSADRREPTPTPLAAARRCSPATPSRFSLVETIRIHMDFRNTHRPVARSSYGTLTLANRARFRVTRQPTFQRNEDRRAERRRTRTFHGKMFSQVESIDEPNKLESEVEERRKTGSRGCWRRDKKPKVAERKGDG